MIGQNNTVLPEINYHALKPNASLIKRVTQILLT